MDRLIHTAVSGMSASMARQRMIASNMANAQTIGFRAEVMTFTPVTLDGEQLDVRAMNQGEVRGASMKGGTLNRTGRDLDVACTGETMLAVQASDGSEVYTRRGDLSVSATGLLQNGEGLAMIGESGPITVPLGSVISIAPDGAVMASNPATPDQPAIRVDRLKIASFTGSRIEKDLSGLFRVPGPDGTSGVLPADEEARLVTATLEQSNVDPSAVLVEMVEAQRLFDIRAKVISTAKGLDEAGASLMRMS